MLTVEVEGVEELQRILARAQEQLQPGRAFGKVVSEALYSLKSYAASITPVRTGRLAAGHDISLHGLAGELFNLVPYAAKVHAMGGHRAFYDRTMTEAAPNIMGRAVQMLGDEIF